MRGIIQRLKDLKRRNGGHDRLEIEFDGEIPTFKNADDLAQTWVEVVLAADEERRTEASAHSEGTWPL